MLTKLQRKVPDPFSVLTKTLFLNHLCETYITDIEFDERRDLATKFQLIGKENHVIDCQDLVKTDEVHEKYVVKYISRPPNTFKLEEI